METYFVLRTWTDFYLPAIATIIIIIFLAFIFGRAYIQEKLQAHRDKKERKHKIKVLEGLGYVKILLDDREVYVPAELAYSEDAQLDPNDARIIYLDRLDSYSISDIEQGRRY